MTKRIFDLVFGSLTLVILSPVMLGVFVYVYKNLGRPVIYSQRRPGLNEKIFKLYKFRTMKEIYDLNGQPLSDEERMTTAGNKIRKLSLDELPQLFNVIRGELSIVGPRPLLEEYLPLYSIAQKKRHLVKPGLTGWAQVNGRNAISWEEKFKLDIWYVENQSFILDMKILYMTLLKVLKRENINQIGQATMEKFTGNNEDEKK